MPTCTYHPDIELDSDDAKDSSKMFGEYLCDTCYAESMDSLTCPSCLRPTGRMQTSKMAGTVSFHCSDCDTTWI